MRKFYIHTIILICFTLILAACGTNENEGSTADNEQNKEDTAKSTDDQDLLSKVKNEGTLLIGTEGTYPPFTFHDNNGNLTGFDVEIAREVARRLGVEAEFLETQWDAMFAGLDAKRFDMVANQVGIREDRLEKYDFSDAYITSSAVLIKRTDNKEINSFEDIKGLKSAQSLTSNYADIAKSFGAEIVGVDGFNQAIELLNSKRVDVTINDRLSFLDFKKQKPNTAVEIADTSEDVAQSGLLFRKGSGEIINEVNNALQEMYDDGTYLKISEKWFGEDVRK